MCSASEREVCFLARIRVLADRPSVWRARTTTRGGEGPRRGQTPWGRSVTELFGQVYTDRSVGEQGGLG